VDFPKPQGLNSFPLALCFSVDDLCPDDLAKMSHLVLLFFSCYWGTPPIFVRELQLRHLFPLDEALKSLLADIYARYESYYLIEKILDAKKKAQAVTSRESQVLLWPNTSPNPEQTLKNMASFYLLCMYFAEDFDEWSTLLSFMQNLSEPLPYLKSRVLRAFEAGQLPMPGESEDLRQVLRLLIELLLGIEIEQFRFKEFLSYFQTISEYDFVMSIEWMLLLNKPLASQWFPLLAMQMNQSLHQAFYHFLKFKADKEIYLNLYINWLALLKPAQIADMLQNQDSLHLLCQIWQAAPTEMSLTPLIQAIEDGSEHVLDFLLHKPSTVGCFRLEPSLAAAILESWCKTHYGKVYAVALTDLSQERNPKRALLWQRLSDLCGNGLAFCLEQLATLSQPELALASLARPINVYQRHLDLGQLQDLIQAQNREPNLLLRQLCLVLENFERDTPLLVLLLVLLQESLPTEQLLSRCLGSLYPWLKKSVNFPKWLVYKAVYDLADHKRISLAQARNLLLIWLGIYDGLTQPADKYHWLRQIYLFRSPLMQKRLWQTFRQYSGDLKWLAAIGLAQQGQNKEVLPYLLTQPERLQCKDGLDALMGLKLKDQATELAWTMLHSLGNCIWDPDEMDTPLWWPALNAIQWYDLDRNNPQLENIWLERPECRERIWRLLDNTLVISCDRKHWIHKRMETDPVPEQKQVGLFNPEFLNGYLGGYRWKWAN
jgi:hypothetical protein